MSTPSFVSHAGVAQATERRYLRLVFAWMFLALCVTTGVAVWFHASASASRYFAQHQGLFWVALIAQLGMVLRAVGPDQPAFGHRRRHRSSSLYAALDRLRLLDPARRLFHGLDRRCLCRRRRPLWRDGRLRVPHAA